MDQLTELTGHTENRRRLLKEWMQREAIVQNEGWQKRVADYRVQIQFLDSLDTVEQQQERLVKATWEMAQEAAIAELADENWEWKQHGIPHVLRNNLPCPDLDAVKKEMEKKP